MERRSGMKYIGALPLGFDERTRIVVIGGRIVAAHPDHKPIVMEMDGSYRTLEVADANGP